MVGCVLVRDGEVVGEGWHREFGGAHAEILALESAGPRARGATAYVTLEPCDHQGKTPPCSRALVQAGVARVVFGTHDPSSDAGGGADTLRRAGVDVAGPVWDVRTGRAENPAFFHTALHAEPYVALKLAMTLDARLAEAPGRSTRITGTEAEASVHRLRAGFDAVMVGAGTARVDDPRLTVRHGPDPRVPPRRIILDPDATLPSDAALLAEAPDLPVHLFTREDVSEAQLERLEDAGAHVHPVSGAGRQLELDAVLHTAWEMGIRSILCEGGARLAASLLRHRKVHRLYLYVAPRTLGLDGVPAFPDDADALEWSDFTPVVPPTLLGRDLLHVLDREDS
jgi:diaminohydroxyphosphoribosylaminopyrimidine deaminase/5-amino-6-(5-phosphoribosylamino)uracil reductase